MNKKTRARLGRRMQLRREQIGLSKSELARLMAVAVEEIETIESGEGRIGADLLIGLSKHLRAPIKFFFSDGKDTDEERGGFSELHGTDTNPAELIRLISAFEAISAADTRLTVIELAERLAHDSYN